MEIISLSYFSLFCFIHSYFLFNYFSLRFNLFERNLSLRKEKKVERKREKRRNREREKKGKREIEKKRRKQKKQKKRKGERELHKKREKDNVLLNISENPLFKFFLASICIELMYHHVLPSKRHCYCQLLLITLSFQKETGREKEQ